jgi:hypothetical protein
LIDGIAVFSWVTGSASPTRIASATAPQRRGWRQSRSPHRSNRAERCSPECPRER